MTQTDLERDEALRRLIRSAQLMARSSMPYRVNIPKVGDLQDCRAFVNMVLSHARLPQIDFPADWTEVGQDMPLPAVEIMLRDARPGDLITFHVTDWMPYFRNHVAIMTEGTGAHARHGKIAHLYACHASVESYLAPWWGKYVAKAYRVLA